MNPADLIQTSSLGWLMGIGLLLGALHALEPGHAKTLIASFVVATRGSVPQAALLGLSAAVSHSLLVWILAGLAIYLGNQFIGDEVEPWLQLTSGVVIVVIGSTMIWRLGRRAAHLQPESTGPRGGKTFRTTDRVVELSVYEEQTPPEFRIHFYDLELGAVAPPDAGSISLQTVRRAGTRQAFLLAARDGYLVSSEMIPEPHNFAATFSLTKDGRRHNHTFQFHEPHALLGAHEHERRHEHDHHHEHGHHHEHVRHEHHDAHAQAHAAQIRQRLHGRSVTTGQIAWFGLSSGLMPCPAALTMLLVCLRLKHVALGVGLVSAFSLGLAATLVTLGVVASLGMQHATRYLPHSDRWMEVLPYCSATLVIGVGVFMSVTGFSALP